MLGGGNAVTCQGWPRNSLLAFHIPPAGQIEALQRKASLKILFCKTVNGFRKKYNKFEMKRNVGQRGKDEVDHGAESCRPHKINR